MEDSGNAALRRLSTRRGTFALLERRRDSYLEGERRRSTLIDRRRSQAGDSSGVSFDNAYVALQAILPMT